MTASETQVCNNPNCNVVNTGVCARQFDPIETCPEYSEAEVNELDPGMEDAEEPSLQSEAHGGQTLRPNGLISEADIIRLRNNRRMQTIVLVGEQRAGKTTLLSAIYGLFCKGPLGAYSFVESRTLKAFAERNHLALVSSNAATPTTPRTSRADPVGFFHLRLKAGEEVSDIVISDRSGEAFEAARTNTSFIQRLAELALADRVCFLLDAAKLTKLETRASYRRTFKQLIHALIDNGALRSESKIEILITKLDRISDAADGRNLEAEILEYEQQLLDEFGGGVFPFEVYKICALPRAKTAIGFVGLEELVARWATPRGDADITPIPVDAPHRQIDRMVKIWK